MAFFFGLGGLSFFLLASIVSGIPLLLASLILLPPVNNYVEKKFNFELSGWLKVITVVVLFLIFCSIDLDDNNSTNSFNQETSGTTRNSAIFTEDEVNLLPLRNDIETEWKIEGITAIEDETATGFISGSKIKFYKIEATGLSASLGIASVYKFDNTNNADAYYANKVNAIKQEGGYEEKSCSGIKADCFCYNGGNLREGFYQVALCKKANLMIRSEIASFNLFVLPYYEDIAKIVVNKI